jgi:hypothetical protein
VKVMHPRGSGQLHPFVQGSSDSNIQRNRSLQSTKQCTQHSRTEHLWTYAITAGGAHTAPSPVTRRTAILRTHLTGDLPPREQICTKMQIWRCSVVQAGLCGVCLLRGVRAVLVGPRPPLILLRFATGQRTAATTN